MIQFSKNLSYIPGLVRGLQQHALIGKVLIGSLEDLNATALGNDVKRLIRNAQFLSSEQHNEEWLARSILNWMVSLLQEHFVVCSNNYHLAENESFEGDTKEFEFFFPYAISSEATLLCLDWFAKLVSHHSERLLLDVDSERKQLGNTLEKFAAPSVNRFEIAKAAFDLDIPFLPFHIDLAFLGQSKHSKMLSSSITEDTPAISAQLAKNKFYTTQILRAAGLPVAQQIRVQDLDSAVEAAEKIGYPVVVKVADKDEGEGVFPLLKNQSEVQTAFQKAIEISTLVLVEKHCVGRTHRLTVFHGSIVKMVQRIPGSVTGNGIHTIEELVAKVHKTRRHIRISERQGRLALDLDEEALSILSELGLAKDSIPANGEFIPLRRKDNASSGGTNKLLDQKEVHPDNQELALDAARILRLDFAGVDFIIPDIGKSWHDQDAIICEINAQPTTGVTDTPNFYQDLLSKFIDGNGRIPIHLVILSESDSEDFERLEFIRKDLGCNGLSCKKGVFLDGEKRTNSFQSSHEAARALVLNAKVTNGLCVYHAAEIIRYGLPSNKFSSVSILGKESDLNAPTSELNDAISLLPPDTSYAFVSA